MIRLLITMRPTPKLRPRFSRGRVYTPLKTVQAEKEIARQAKAQCQMVSPLEGPLKVVMVFQIKKPKSVKRQYPIARPDLDNYIKLCSDALGQYWKDDAQIVELHCVKRYGKEDLIIVDIDRFVVDPFDAIAEAGYVIHPEGL